MADVFSIVEPKDVKWIFLSHDYADHTGNLRQMLESCENATLVTNWFTVERLAGERGEITAASRAASAFMRARSGTETFLRSCAELVMKLWASLDRGATHPDAACNLAIGRRLPKARGSTCCERHIAWPKAVGHRSR